MKSQIITAPKRAKTDEYQGVFLNGTASHLSLGNSSFYALPFNFTIVLRLNYLYSALSSGIQSFIRKGGSGTNRWSVNKSSDSQYLQIGFVTAANVADQLSIPFSNIKLFDWTHIVLKRTGDNSDISTAPGWPTSVRNPANYKLYIDGVHVPWTLITLANSTNGINWDFNNTSPLLIGKYDSTTPTYIKMLVDYFGYYDRALTAEEITACFATNNLPSFGAKGIFNFNGDLIDGSSVNNPISLIDNTYPSYLEFPHSSRTAFFKSGIANQIFQYYFTDPVSIVRMWKDQTYFLQYSLDRGTNWTTFTNNAVGENVIAGLDLVDGGDFWIQDTVSRSTKQLAVFDILPYNPSVITYKNLYISYDAGLKQFTVFCKLNTNNYYSRLVFKNIVSGSIRANIWRIIDGQLFRKVNNDFVSQNINLLTSGENEFVFRENGKSDLTGGYHGDELQTAVSASIDGVSLGVISSLTSFNLREANTSFVFTQNSNMLETDNSTATVIATHVKENTFRATGYKSRNLLTASRNIDISYYYHGIVCITPEIAKFAKNEAGTIRTMTRNGSDSDHFLGLSNVHLMQYWNDVNGMKADVTAKIVGNPTRDALGIVTTKDTKQYGKYYRNLPAFTMNIGEVIESESEVVFDKI